MKQQIISEVMQTNAATSRQCPNAAAAKGT